jgi:class 3 adenylate cyclase/predicted ATPase
MFCDLVGSTALSARLDPEDMREIIGAYHRCCAEQITKAGGFVAKYMGDGVLAYFGYPQAHEDDAERSLRAGLGLVDAVPKLPVRHDESLQMRIGIATGLVVVGDLIGGGAAQEQGVVGETPNLAARLQGIAESGQIVISHGTRRLTGGVFEYRDLGQLSLKGLSEPVQAWQVIGVSTVQSRFEAQHGTKLTPLVGRQEELELLLRRWQRAKGGEGQAVLLSGEPGIGKSRLTVALQERLQNEPHTRLRYFCSPHHLDSAFYPIITQLERAAGFEREDTPKAKLNKVASLLGSQSEQGTDIQLATELLSVSTVDRYPPLTWSAQRKKEQTVDMLLRQLDILSRRQPVLMQYEDVHWIDPSSRELLDLTVERIGSLPVLLVITFRPEFQPPWTGQPQVTMLVLNRLDRRDRTMLVEQIAGDKALPEAVIQQIVDRADGVPLFVEELTKSVLESGVVREEEDRYVLERSLPPFAIPMTLHDSLLARLDRLASVRLVAQIGAAIGREFSYSLVRAVSNLPEDQLQAALGRLVASELVFQRGVPPSTVYSFKHALVQDAAHGSLLRATRQQLHAQIAGALENQSPELLDSQPEVFAQHYSEAGLVEQSVACWRKAGRRSVTRSAMMEAAAQFQKGLDELVLLPDNAERQRQELEFLSALGAVFQAIKGYAAPETGQTYARARKLWEQLGSPAEFLQVPYGQSRYHMGRGELDLVRRLDEDLLRVSRQQNNSAGLALGHLSYGRGLMLVGKFSSSRCHLEDGIALYDPISHRPLGHQIGVDPHVISLSYYGIVLFCLGSPHQALARGSAAIAEARRLGHPPSLGFSLSLVTVLLSLIGDDVALDERVDELVAVATEQGFPVYRAVGMLHRAWIVAKNVNVAEGISLLRSGLAAYRATGTEMWTSHFFCLLARACEIAGQAEEGLAGLDDGLQTVERTGMRWFAAELSRLKGQLLLQQGHTGSAEELYRKALSIADEQNAKLWELRAAASLARLWRDQGKRTEARDLLAPIYGWFTEGFDTPDLKEAEALLDELS